MSGAPTYGNGSQMRLTRTKVIAILTGLFSQAAMAQPATGELTWFEVARIGDAKYARTVFAAREGAVEGGFAKYWSRVIYTAPHTVSVYDNALIAPENVKGSAQYIEMRTLHLMDWGKKDYA